MLNSPFIPKGGHPGTVRSSTAKIYLYSKLVVRRHLGGDSLQRHHPHPSYVGPACRRPTVRTTQVPGLASSDSTLAGRAVPPISTPSLFFSFLFFLFIYSYNTQQIYNILQYFTKTHIMCSKRLYRTEIKYIYR